jgi:signal transduction histidine kinase
MDLKLHPILNRSLKKSAIDVTALDASMIAFIESISNSFYSYDRERNINERAFAVSELEYQNINQKLKIESENKTAFIIKLRETIHQLEDSNPDSIVNNNSTDVNVIIDYLKDLVVKQKQTEAELIKAKLFAEKAASAKSEFLSIMSHEIRTPLNAIIGIANLLPKNDDNKENIDALKFSSDHLLLLINDILDFNKLEDGSIRFQKNNIHLRSLVDKVVQMSNAKAKEKNTSISVSVNEKVPEIVEGDLLRLSQVLSNLISNAVKFTTNGQIAITIDVGAENETSIDLKFTVKDTGIGIAKEKQVQIFEKFTQAESSIANKFGGTGLGLTISKKILQLQKSNIYVESEPNKGSAFYFTLQFAKVDIDNSNTNFRSEPSETNSLQGANILVVDDNKFNLLVIKQFLLKWEANVTVCESGIAAIEQITNESYDLVLMDLQMPEMDGYEAANKINAIKNNTPIIALTAAIVEDVRAKALKNKMVDVLAKPFKANDVFTVLKKYLN